MVFDEQKKKELQDVFKSVYSLQDEAKMLNITANDNIGGKKCVRLLP